MTGEFEVMFLDAGREPKCKPNPNYPDGIAVNLAKPGQKSCTRNLPYPAPRCGAYAIKCLKCKVVNMITVAGRPDDPNQVTMPCGVKLDS